MGRVIDGVFAALGKIGRHKVTMDLEAMSAGQRAWHELYRLERETATTHPLHEVKGV